MKKISEIDYVEVFSITGEHREKLVEIALSSFGPENGWDEKEVIVCTKTTDGINFEHWVCVRRDRIDEATRVAAFIDGVRVGLVE